MNSIKSNGGPLIALDRADVARWGGMDALRFFGSSSLYKSDYDYLYLEAKVSGGFFTGVTSSFGVDVLIIYYPIDTLIISKGNKSLHLAQIDASEPDWSPDNLTDSDFEGSLGWVDPFEITWKSGEIVFFDSACVEADFHDDILSVKVDAGTYRCECSRRTWEGKADVNLIRLLKNP